MAALLVGAGVLGLVVGSFLNVVVHRVPLGQSVVSPPSACPSCGSRIRTRHNVPVAGWLVLRGRCADCDTPISARYPLVELATGLLFAAVAWRIIDLHLAAALPAYLYFTAIGVALTLIDLDTRRLPNAIVLPSYPVLAVLLGVSAALREDWWSLARAGLGAAALFTFFLLVVLAHPAGMGWGDVKLAGLLGAVLAHISWATFAVGAFAGFVLGAAVGIAVMAARQGGRKTALPFGPFMIAGALLGLFAGDPIGAFYLEYLTG
ncbi:prepilin peptidase [Actinophytocola sp.]|uniref:prepilin peptidase n=1 Tax=Actinophytocola sp. TaxID=1872138 RepID=UPI002ED2F57D